jgi:thiamine pyrophosphokinase
MAAMKNNGHHFAILLGGDLTPTKRLRQQIAGARVIAADGGMRHAAVLGVVPELWLGDFDSSDVALDQAFANVPRQTFPAAKDMTDGALAIAEALRLGATRIFLAGGFGGRFDHALGHGLQLLSLAERGIDCMMTSGSEEAYPLLDEFRLQGMAHGTRFSVLGLGAMEGLSIAGARWPLDRVAVPLGSTWTLSNEVDGDVHFSLERGRALVVVYPEEPSV